MNLNFLPRKYLLGLDKVNLETVYELRLRAGHPVKINIKSKWYYLCCDGATIISGQAIVCDVNDIIEIINNITERSVYAYNNNIKQGFLTCGGIRVGLCGECVVQNYDVITIKNISSLNIRIPHEIDNCSNAFFDKILNKNSIFNTLIISPPFYGKTTMLKDTVKKLNNLNLGSLLVIDERAEFERISGENIDKITYSNKIYAFEYGLRSMSPSIVITDELITKDDWTCCKRAVDSGVKILATCHGDSLSAVRSKEYFIDNVFDRFVVLVGQGSPGVVDSVYNEVFEKI